MSMIPMRLSVGTTISGGVAGTVGSGQVAYGQSLNVLTSSSSLTFDGTTLVADSACTLGTSSGRLTITSAGVMQFSGSVGIEAGTGSDTMFRLRGNSQTSGVNQYGAYIDTIFSSSATSGVFSVAAIPNLANASFTAGYVYAFYAADVNRPGGTATATRVISYGGPGPTNGTNNAWAADNITFSGSYLFNFASTNPSLMSGTLTLNVSAGENLILSKSNSQPVLKFEAGSNDWNLTVDGSGNFDVNDNGGNTRLAVSQAGSTTIGASATTPVHAVNTSTQTTIGAAGGASALPATPTGYWIVAINGTNRVIPYYAAS